jgi:hypothetical protein
VVELVKAHAERARAFARAHAKAYPGLTASEIGALYRAAHNGSPAMVRAVVRQVIVYRRQERRARQ